MALFILGMKSSVGVAVRVPVRVPVFLVDFAVGVTVAVAVGVTIGGVAVAVTITGSAIRVSVTVSISFKSVGSSNNLFSPWKREWIQITLQINDKPLLHDVIESKNQLYQVYRLGHTNRDKIDIFTTKSM